MRQWFCIALLLTATYGVYSVIHADELAAQESSENITFGPETEKRFPPLTLPDGFEATLFACDPLVEYPSVIALGPHAGSLFAAHDYMTGLGLEIVRRDEVRLIEDSNADGYADRSTVFAGGFNSIQGLAFHDDNVFVMHAPSLTRLRDTDGDGVADERQDLIEGLGLPPEENDNRLHCANGVVAGYDGWLYLALGDRGCDVQRPEGDRLLFQQGGILRCRTDGSDLHVFSTGLRNIYDVALDEELSVFVRDNENDGGDYMIRVCHCFFGSDHGYPYHYYERPDEPMPPLADLGRGSSAGGVSYNETAFPPDYRDSLYFCEWGRGVVRYHKTRRSSSFKRMTESDFAYGAKDDPYGFKPTDLVIDYDGSMLISDWCDGQRPKRGRGRIYRISCLETDGGRVETATQASELDTASLIRQLDADSLHQRTAAQLELQKRGTTAVSEVVTALENNQLAPRARMHALWILALTADGTVPHILLDLAESDSDARVQSQAIRAIGDLTDPILKDNRLESRAGDHRLAGRIAKIAEQADPRVVLEAIIVMRRLHWPATPEWLVSHWSAQDPALDHAAQQALRNCSHWPAVIRLLEESPRFRRIALHAMAEQRTTFLVDQFIERLKQKENPALRREYVDALSRIVRKNEPWTYWGFRPQARPAATIAWERTTDIEKALNAVLLDTDVGLRDFTLGRMLREGIVPEFSVLATWLQQDTDEQRVSTILETLRTHHMDQIQPILIQTTLRSDLTESNRLIAVSMLIKGMSDDAASLVELATKLDDGPVLASLLHEFGQRPGLAVDELLLKKLDSDKPIVRLEAIRTLARRKNKSALDHIERLLLDTDANVILAAVKAAGQLGAVRTTDTLLGFTRGSDRTLITASLDSLRKLQDNRAVSVALNALDYQETQSAAIEYLTVFGTPDQIDFIVEAAARNPAYEIQSKVVQALSTWQTHFADARERIQTAISIVHGNSGQPLAWHVSGPLSTAAADESMEELKTKTGTSLNLSGKAGAATVIAEGFPPALSFNETTDDKSVRLTWTTIRVNRPTNIELLTSATGRLSLWMPGGEIHAREKPGQFLPDSDRIPVRLETGTSLLIARIEPDGGNAARFHLRFRRHSSKAEHERLIAHALKTDGNVDRGREVFANVEKSSCIRCHRMGIEGGRIGPDLTGIGSRFSRIHLIESILEPSRTVAPSYKTIVVVLEDGKVMTGVRVSESDKILVIGDNQGKLHQIPVANVAEIATQTVSTMPEGLEKKLTDREFTDLLAFLESETSARSK